MFKYIVVLALVPALAFATEGVYQCRNGLPMPNYINVNGCDAVPCTIQLGTTASMIVGFQAPHDIAKFSPSVYAGVLGLWIPYSVGDIQGCDYMVDGRCPISAGEDVEYEFQFAVAAIYPTISVDIELTLTSDQGEINCVTVPISVIN